MTVNVKLLRETLEFIKAHPNDWDQDFWRWMPDPEDNEPERCGTVMCFAGWAAELGGCRWVAKPHQAYAEYVQSNEADRRWLERNPDRGWAFATVKGRQAVSVQVRAQRVLGLNDEQASLLFNGSNDLDVLEGIVDELCQGYYEADDVKVPVDA